MDILNPKKNKQANNKWHVILYLMGVSILSRLFKGILSTTIVILSYPKLLSFSVLTFIKGRTNATLDFFQITQSKVLDILQILKLGKASGLDSISHQMLKKTCNTVCVSSLSLVYFIAF
jgi:hypothetical protein